MRTKQESTTGELSDKSTIIEMIDMIDMIHEHCCCCGVALHEVQEINLNLCS